MKQLFIALLLLIFSLPGFSQLISHCQINDLHWYNYQKLNIEDLNFHSSIKEEYFKFDFSKDSSYRTFYTLPSIFFGRKNKFDNDSLDRYLSINPILTSSFSLDKSGTNILHDLKAGISAFGIYKYKFKYNADFLFANTSFSDYISNTVDSSGIIPHYGKYLSSKNGNYSYLSYTGNLNYAPAEYINFEIGRGKTFWGHGYRSLLLSDNSNAYPYFKSTVDVWRIKYVYMIAKLKDFDSNIGFDKLQNKYSVQHYLSVNITKWLNFNFFEAVIASPVDSLGAKRGLDVNYLNPVIFLRPIEASIGTTDNVLMGFGGSLKLWKYHQFYGQIILDEFILSHIKARDGWWGNKHGIQIGFNSFKAFLIKDLYAQIEFSYVRPYTYSHQSSIRNWGNYYQPMAHPLGANFKEVVGVLRYDFDDLYLSAKVVYNQFGTNSDSLNVGQNIYQSYDKRIKELGNFVGQGLVNELIFGELKASYLLVYNWNLFFEASLIFRRYTLETIENKNLIFTLGLKTLLFNENYDY
jgi:hypothetical protein